MVYKWLFSNLLSLWPAHCYLCLQTGQTERICAACRRDLPVLMQACPRCGIGLPDTGAEQLCAACLTEPPAYTKVISALAYTAPVARFITDLKFHNKLQYAPLLADLLLERVTRDASPVEAIVPVPLHRRRLRERGFNQALEIARPLARKLGLPLLANALTRVRETAPQSLQAARDRHTNVRDAFAVGTLPRFRHIALVDDVMTSGHTVGEAAKCLREAGVETIEVWCAARASSHA